MNRRLLLAIGLLSVALQGAAVAADARKLRIAEIGRAHV